MFDLQIFFLIPFIVEMLLHSLKEKKYWDKLNWPALWASSYSFIDGYYHAKEKPRVEINLPSID